jgi:hypothetical protein
VSNLGRFLRRQQDLFAECILPLDGLLGIGHDRVLGGLGQSFLHLLELYECHQSVGHLVALLIAVIGSLDVSPNGDDSTWSWHIQYQVGIVQNYHELGECQPSQESVVHSLKIGNLELYSFSLEVLSSPEGYRKRDLTDGHCYCTGDYVVERSSTGM